MALKKLGLLDFQDALIGSPIYDLVSILEDARIDIDRDFALSCAKYYAKKKKVDLQHTLLNYHILGSAHGTRGHPASERDFFITEAYSTTPVTFVSKVFDSMKFGADPLEPP